MPPGQGDAFPRSDVSYDFSLKHAKQFTGLPRISLKKYLAHLRPCGELSGEAVYSLQGRPARLYHWIYKE